MGGCSTQHLGTGLTVEDQQEATKDLTSDSSHAVCAAFRCVTTLQFVELV